MNKFRKKKINKNLKGTKFEYSKGNEKNPINEFYSIIQSRIVSNQEKNCSSQFRDNQKYHN